MYELKRKDLLYPELSFKIIGCAFSVHNEIGYGFKEIIYQKALSHAFKEASLSFQEQVQCEIKYKSELLGTRYLDFIVEGKIIIEIKRNDAYSKAHMDQTVEYLKATNQKLAILINFGSEGVRCKRLINPNAL
ncbi:MAG: GxxExxY protein [Bacteroidota bacterium]|nr:GxxExxY protein [Bacteroidota bacterium]